MAKRKATDDVWTRGKKRRTGRKLAKAKRQPPRASLLGLPAEIRNTIYRLAFVDTEEAIDISYNAPDNLMLPGLLRSCFQIREEALSIFLEEDMFKAYFECYPITPQLGHWFWKQVPTEGTRIDGGEHVKWKDVMTWFEKFRKGSTDQSVLEQLFLNGSVYQSEACMKAIEAVEQLQGVSWENVEKV